LFAFVLLLRARVDTFALYRQAKERVRVLNISVCTWCCWASVDSSKLWA